MVEDSVRRSANYIVSAERAIIDAIKDVVWSAPVSPVDISVRYMLDSVAEVVRMSSQEAAWPVVSNEVTMDRSYTVVRSVMEADACRSVSRTDTVSRCRTCCRSMAPYRS